ncbi:MAG: alpha/beta hydrolase [Gammaproteobacteria bacterium]
MANFVLDFRCADQGGAVVPGKLTLANLTLDALQQCRDVVFLIHGFNVNRPVGSAELQAFANLLPAAARGAAVAVLWPGDAWSGPLCYPFETNKADDSAVELAKYIGDNLPHACISFVAHSLGCRVAMETVRQLYIKGVDVAQVCLMAGAIDNNSLALTAAYRSAAQYSARTAVLYSPSDTVLKSAYPAGNLLSAFLHWSATTDAPLGYAGPRAASDGAVPDTVAATGIPAAIGVNHGDYLPGADGVAGSKQLSAARFANAVLSGAPQLIYG